MSMMIAVIFSAMQASASPTALPPAAPANDPRTWVRAEDYPEAAKSVRAQGNVAFRATVNADGMVQRCMVEESSGNADLDLAACQLVQQRARFASASDMALRSYVGRVRWTLPDVIQGPAAVALNDRVWSQVRRTPHGIDTQGRTLFTHFRLTVAAEGRPTGCSIERPSGFDQLDREACALVMKKARFRPFSGDARSYLGQIIWSNQYRDEG